MRIDPRTNCATAESLQMGTVALFISSTYLSHAFVASGEEDDGDEREDERKGAGDVPLGEDDA